MPKAVIVEHFGAAVANLVEEVTDDKSLSKAERKEKQVASARHKTDGAKVIRLADKTSNLRTIGLSPPPGLVREAEDRVRGLVGLFVDEVVHRMNLVRVAPNSYHRISSTNAVRLDFWKDIVRKSYPLKSARPTLTEAQVQGADVEGEESPTSDGTAATPRIKSHKAVSIRSVIDVHAWEQARWRGAGYIQTHPLQPHYLALMFENGEGARKIFERWRERFGSEDSDNEIHLAIIRALPGQNPHHYSVIVTAKPPADTGPDHTFVFTSRSMTMEPTSGTNLEGFLASYRRFGSFHLIPAVLSGSHQPDLLFNLAITKRTIVVKAASEVQEHDIEAIGLRAADPRRRT